MKNVLIIAILFLLSTQQIIFAEVEENSGKNEKSGFGQIVDNTQNSLFTGDVNLSLPIATPPGLTVSLNYNSNIVRQVTTPAEFMQNSWVGLGWSLNFREHCRG